MILDSSALVAILLQEPDAGAISRAIEQSTPRLLSAANFVESAIVIESRRRETGAVDLDRLLARASIEIAPITVEIAQMARIAYRFYGKGRHAAGLNFGDCFTYALAKVTGYPVLAKGPEFARTDIEVVAV